MNRRNFLKAGGLVLVAAGAGLGPFLPRNRRLYGKTMPLMGTIGEIQVVHDDASTAYRAIDAAFEELNRLERLLSYYRDDSEIGIINRLAFQREVLVSEETGRLIERALHWSNATNGIFEPGLGKVVELWDVKNRTVLPAEKEWKRFADQSFFRKIELSEKAGAYGVRFNDDNVRMDLGGIAKGYAADQAIAILVREGLSQAIVNLGGDIATLGGKSAEQGWRIGIKDPSRSSEIIKILTLRNQSVATSGSYEQYFMANNEVYHHLIDPKIAEPGHRSFASLTVIGDNCRDADALATGLFLMSNDKARRVLEDNTNRFEFMRL